MKIVHDDMVLRVVDSTLLLAFIAGAGLILCVGRLGFVLTYGAPGKGEIAGMSIGAFIFLVGVMMFSRKSDFQFDRYARKLIWRRGGLLGQSEGEVPFDEIQEVIVERKEIYSDGGHATGYRLGLRLRNSFNDILPVKESYSTGTQKNCEEYATRIREALGKTRA